MIQCCKVCHSSNSSMTCFPSPPPIWGRCFHAQLSGRETWRAERQLRGLGPEPGTVPCKWFFSSSLRAYLCPASPEGAPPASLDHGAGAFLLEKG